MASAAGGSVIRSSARSRTLLPFGVRPSTFTRLSRPPPRRSTRPRDSSRSTMPVRVEASHASRSAKSFIGTDRSGSSSRSAVACGGVRTFAPPLSNLPSADCGTNDINVPGSFIGPACARERQGLNAAILDQESPLNILEDVPNNGGQFHYNPMWDIHLVHWNDSVPVTSRLRQTDFARAEALVGTQAQSITGRLVEQHLPGNGLHRELPADQHLAEQLAPAARTRQRASGTTVLRRSANASAAAAATRA